MPLFLAHAFLLLGAAAATARGLFRGGVERVLATVVLAWGNLVVTCLLLATAHRLGEPAWFFRTSLALAFVTWLGLRRVGLEPGPAQPAPPAAPAHAGLIAGIILTLVPIGYASIRIACTYVPNNYDSLAYHLPRAMYYLGQNTLAHFDTGNPRQIYFPFNYNLLQLFGLVYSPPLQVLNFLNLAAWATAGLAIFRVCRLCGLGLNSALVAAWLAFTSTQVLAQGTATTNDLPTAAGLLCTLVFVLRWRDHRLTRDALLAGLAAGLTAGAKLTVIFFGPAAGLIVLGVAWQHWRRGEVGPFLRGVRAWLLPALLALALAAPFAAINLAEKGEWINHTYDFTLNRPFSWGCVVQTGAAYLVQLFIEPLHRFTYDLAFTAQLNAWSVRTFFPHWNEAYAFSPPLLFPPDLNEDHVWFGFTGPFLFLCAVFCVFRTRSLRQPAAWCGWLGLGWFATYFLLNKWSLYNQRYFVPSLLVMSPCAALVVEAGWNSPRFRRGTRFLVAVLALCSVWLAGVYLFKNTSRPYAPLWAGEPAPQALPTLPPLMVQRLADQPRVNIDSTDGNERIFLLMGLGRNQRFTSFSRVNPDAYNVFSEWGFVRKVAYSNIEQRSSYTLVAIPTKRTAGVEFLGTLGSGQWAIDYYGLVPKADQVAAAEGNRNVIVVLSYGRNDPGRYAHLPIKVAGLNPSDHARLTVGVEYEDGTTATLATFTATGEAQASVTRPFRRFTVRVQDQADGHALGTMDIPYLFRDEPPEYEAPHNPVSLFSDELVVATPKSRIVATGLSPAEGPYPQWDLPVIRWVKEPVLRLEIPEQKHLGRLDLAFELRLHTRESAHFDVLFNGALVAGYEWSTPTGWFIKQLSLTPRPGPNVIEFRNVAVGTEPDWLDYLERYPDVKAYLVAQHKPLAEGAQEHYEAFGKKEKRALYLQRRTEKVTGDQYYFMFRSLRVDGSRAP